MENDNKIIKETILGETCIRIKKLEPTQSIYTRIVRKFQKFFLWERKQVLAYDSPIELYMTLLKKDLLPFEYNIIRQIHLSLELRWTVIIESHPEHKTNEIVCDVCFLLPRETKIPNTTEIVDIRKRSQIIFFSNREFVIFAYSFVECSQRFSERVSLFSVNLRSYSLSKFSYFFKIIIIHYAGCFKCYIVKN